MEKLMDEHSEIDEAFIRASLMSDEDIPPASRGFARRCLAAVRSSDALESPGLLRTYGFRIAASVAAAAVVAALVVTRVSGPERVIGETAESRVEDIAVVGVTASVPAAAGSTATSNESVVNANPGATALWKALNAGQAQMAWEWPDRAKSARLTITGAGVTAERVYGKGDAFPVWNPPVPEDFNEDDVFTVKLTFYNGERGGGEEVACLVAKGIGFVRGVSGEASRLALEREAMFQIVKK